MTGRVIYSSGGNYRVLSENKIYFCKPLGKFRNQNIKILVGDIVDIEVNEYKEGLEELNIIINLYERKNEFIRPNISNVDHAILVTSITKPKLNDYYLDKLITIFQSRSIEPILIFTKKDLGIDKEQQTIINDYLNNDYKILVTSQEVTQEEKDILKKWLGNKFSVITGQTGVGKSTLLNNLKNDLALETGDISKALGRGRHTTRHSEAFEIFENSFVVDTPGFSSLEINDLENEIIFWNFFSFEKYAYKCKFKNCSHLKEEDCEIKKQNFSERTWKNYKKILLEVRNGK